MSSSTYARLALLGVVAVFLGACTSSHETASPPTPSASVPVTSAAPGVAGAKPQPCGPGATAFWLPGPDNTKLEANAFGSGRTAAVFLHEAGRLADMCGFWPFARWLAVHRHVLVVLVNRCTYGRSTCQLFHQGDDGVVSQTGPAVAWARRHGARRVVLVGASAGGGDALQAAGVVPHVAAVVDLSGDRTDTGTDELTDAPRLHRPALFALAPGDPYCDLARMRTVYRAVRSAPKRLVVVTGRPGVHGWDLLQDALGARFTPLARVVADWVVGRTR